MTQQECLAVFKYKDGRLLRRNKAPKKGWQIVKGTTDSLGYVRTTLYRRKQLIHRIVFVMHHGYLPECVDHIDFNPSNNRIENLRASTKAENCSHRSEIIYNKHGYRGIRDSKNRWSASIMKDGVTYTSNPFDTKEEAARVYDIMATAFHGEFCGVLNFPDSKEKS